MPRSSAIMVPAVRTAMSSSIALRRSPNPGAFTAATLRPPRSLLTTRVAKASPSMSSATMSNGFPAWTMDFEDGEQRLKRRELLLVDEDVGVLKLGHHLLGIGDEIGRQVTAIELHSFDDVEFGFGGLILA